MFSFSWLQVAKQSIHNGLFLVGCIVLYYFEPQSSQLLRFDRFAIEQGQWWRLFTSHWVHLGFHHALMNITGLLLLIATFLKEQNPWPDLLTVTALAWLIGLLIYWYSPQIAYYVGFSGILHGYLAYYVILAARQMRILSLCVWGGLAAKILYEQSAWFNDDKTAALIGGAVAVDAHLYGFIFGTVSGLGWYFYFKKSA